MVPADRIHINPDNPPVAPIRRLLRAAFSPQTLRRFCDDRPGFRELSNRFGPNDGLDSMVDTMIQYCGEFLLWDRLLEGISEANRAQYDRFAPELSLVALSREQAEVRDARGMPLGDNNTIYGYILSDRYAPLAHKLVTFTTEIEEKTRDFVGRDAVFEALDQFMAREPSGYFFIEGQPGIGKSALMAQLTRKRGYVHHFNIASKGITSATQFLENVCAQLIAVYQLDRPPFLPPEAGQDGTFFSTLLEEASRKSSGERPVVILVDALDEVEWSHGSRRNLLYLPSSLPQGVFIVATTRPREDQALHVERYEVFPLKPDSPNNQADALAYIRAFAQRDDMQRRLERWGTSLATFARALLKKSEGNFMYLHYVLPAIESGQFVHGNLEELPQGLKDYYERHWEEMRTRDEDIWLSYRMPVICFLSAAQEPATVWQIADWAKIPAPRVLAAIRDWRQFLDEEILAGVKRYRIYHASFAEFLADQDETKAMPQNR